MSFRTHGGVQRFMPTAKPAKLQLPCTSPPPQKLALPHTSPPQSASNHLSGSPVHEMLETSKEGYSSPYVQHMDDETQYEDASMVEDDVLMTMNIPDEQEYKLEYTEAMLNEIFTQTFQKYEEFKNLAETSIKSNRVLIDAHLKQLDETITSEEQELERMREEYNNLVQNAKKVFGLEL